MNQRVIPATPDEKIAHHVKKVWRPLDREAIADKRDPAKQRAQYKALQDLRKLADEAVK